MKNWEAKPHPGKEGCVVTTQSVSAVDPKNWPMVIWGPEQGYALGQSMALAKDKETADLIVRAVNAYLAAKTVNNFDVLKRMGAENKDIRMSPSSNFLRMQTVKAGTQITVGVQGDVVGALYSGELVGCLLLFNKKQFDELKKKMEEEQA